MKSLTLPYRNAWFRFIQYLIVTLILEASFIVSLSSFDLSNSSQMLLLFFSIHLCSMFFVAFALLAYIHRKSPHYQIILDDEMLIVPKKSVIPDSFFIHYDNILFEGLYDGNRKYKIVFNGGSVTICKGDLYSDTDWDKIVYSIKSTIL